MGPVASTPSSPLATVRRRSLCGRAAHARGWAGGRLLLPAVPASPAFRERRRPDLPRPRRRRPGRRPGRGRPRHRSLAMVTNLRHAGVPRTRRGGRSQSARRARARRRRIPRSSRGAPASRRAPPSNTPSRTPASGLSRSGSPPAAANPSSIGWTIGTSAALLSRYSRMTSSSATPSSMRSDATAQPVRSLPVVQWTSAGRFASTARSENRRPYPARALSRRTNSR